jgi:predicted nucleotidyltransferase
MLKAVIPIETFFKSDLSAKYWPESITENIAFKGQAQNRKNTIKIVEKVVSRLSRPDISLENAVWLNNVSEKQLVRLYESLGNLFENEPDYRRLVFYLPFEFLPNIKWEPSSRKLQKAINRFSHGYMKAWTSLLTVSDVRANFTDGDILEPGLWKEELKRVVKAAHLIPSLVEKGLLTITDVFRLYDETSNSILKKSIADILPFLCLLTQKNLDYMEKSDDILLKNAVQIIKNNKSDKTQAIKLLSLPDIQKNLKKKNHEINRKDYGNISASRKSWLLKTKTSDAIEASGKQISPLIAKNLPFRTISRYLSAKANPLYQLAVIEGIRIAIESVGANDPEKGNKLYLQYESKLVEAWQTDNPETRKIIQKLFFRLYHAGILPLNQLEKLEISIPEFAGSFSKNLKLMGRELNETKNILAAIKNNREISKMLYPVIILYGSQFKGYGSETSDIDLAIFVKPETPYKDRPKMQSLVKKYLSEKIYLHEFWLKETDNKLSVCYSSDINVTLGKSYWAHILFGAAWFGEKQTILQLFDKLLLPYFSDERNRKLHLEELEIDSLLYRLLHKGYARFFSNYGGNCYSFPDEDEKVFFDSGYRQLATRIFLKRIFLPRIPNLNK